MLMTISSRSSSRAGNNSSCDHPVKNCCCYQCEPSGRSSAPINKDEEVGEKDDHQPSARSNHLQCTDDGITHQKVATCNRRAECHDNGEHHMVPLLAAHAHYSPRQNDDDTTTMMLQPSL